MIAKNGNSGMLGVGFGEEVGPILGIVGVGVGFGVEIETDPSGMLIVCVLLQSLICPVKVW